jgi:competence protein ComEC
MDYFFVLILGFASGILVRSEYSFGWSSVAFVLLLSFVFFFLRYSTNASHYTLIGLFVLCAAFGGGRTILAPQKLPDAFVPLIGTEVTLRGTVAADPDIRDSGARITVDVNENGARTRVLAVTRGGKSFAYGEPVSISGVLELPAAFDTEGGRTFAYDRYLAKDGVFALIQNAQVKSLGSPTGVVAFIMNGLFDIKHAFADGIEEALPMPSAALAEGLLVGGKQGLGKELTDAFTTAGLIAIVVLSGYNVMIVADAILRALSRLPKRIALIAAGGGIIAFVLAAGAGSSAVRAGLMACLALYARASGRSYDALRALAFVLLLMLLWNPLLLAYDGGFELSFVATLGLIIGTPLIEVRIAFIKNTFLREIIATTTAAQIAILPLLLYLTGNLSLVSFPANILVLPVIPLAMALSFVAGIVGIVAPFLAAIAGLPAYFTLSYILWIGETAASLPLAHVIIPAFSAWILVPAYWLLWYFAKKLRERSTPKPSQTSLRTRSS